MEKKAPMTMKLSAEAHRSLKILAAETGQTMAQIVETIISEHLAKQPTKKKK